MPLSARLFADDEELGKKNDDHVPGQSDLSLEDTWQWARHSMSTPKRRRRFALVGLFVVVVFLIFSYSGERPAAPPEVAATGGLPPGAKPTAAPTGAAPRPEIKNANELHYYDGPSNYYDLSKSLQASSRTQGLRVRNKNVLFAAASLQSLDRLLPMACEMAKWNRNMVHVAVVGRHDVPIQKIQELNNLDSNCAILWHDARPDYAKYSTDARFSQSVFLTLEHMWNWIHPQVFIVENEEAEEPVFLQSVTKHAHRHGGAVIQLPQNAMQTMQWMARLDSGSLGAWETTHVEVLIRAPTGQSASLIRLLRSLSKADYFGKQPPHLTIELPAFMDQSTEDFLDKFEWPPRQKHEDAETGPTYVGAASAPPHIPQITLQRRLLRERLTPVEASMRYIEGFYPTRTRDSHVLVLSPEVQLSPLYYHYLTYNLLEYKHSTFAMGTRDVEQLAGISLISPQTLLDGTTPLVVPSSTSEGDYADTTFFQLQEPDTRACLYFGDKWRELHAFFAQRLDSPIEADSNLVSYSEPAFASYFLELMRARGYFVLHPGALDAALATVHKELGPVPEEWRDRVKDYDPEQHEVDPEPLDEAAGTGGRVLTHPPPAPARPHLEHPLAWTPLHILLPSDGDLPELSSVPMLGANGQQIESLAAADRAARQYTATFRSSIGGCASFDRPAKRKGLEADDLFCGHWYSTSMFDNVERDEWGDVIPPPMTESEKKNMQDEFRKHLERQRGDKSPAAKTEEKKQSFAELATDYIDRSDKAETKDKADKAEKKADVSTDSSKLSGDAAKPAGKTDPRADGKATDTTEKSAGKNYESAEAVGKKGPLADDFRGLHRDGWDVAGDKKPANVI